MLKRLPRFTWFERHREYGAVFIRLIIGFHLVWNTQDNVFSYARMLEFKDFLAAHGFPLPLLCAYVSAYAQFICGSLYIIGARVRFAAVVVMINFVVALLMVHVGLSEQQNFPALMMLFGSAFLSFNGAGPFSIARLTRRWET